MSVEPPQPDDRDDAASLPEAGTAPPAETPADRAGSHELPSPEELLSRLDEVMTLDRARLRAKIRNLQRIARHHDHRGVPTAQILTLAHEIERARARVTQRRLQLPRPTYPGDLPVVARRDDIARAIAEHQVVVVCGATGSGKTTQLPKICLEVGRGVRGLIGHTQPRRIAARSVAQRIATELGTSVGRGVGFKVRFTDQVSERTYVKLMTDGILLAETQGDQALSAYDTLIIDEAHERSLNIDFLLGYLRQLLPHRPDLKVIITSATIAPRQFAEFFAQAGKPEPPVIEVSGRTYPVEVRYRPLIADEEDQEDRDLTQGVLDAVDELAKEPKPPGMPSGTTPDVLVFLPGEREIRETAEALRKHHPRGTEIVPLYGRLSAEDQQKIFEGHAQRRVVLATNVAETSLTVPGIVYVVDSGLARISRYSPRVKVQRLPIEAISRASAAQRAGRCGRVCPGVCLRLYGQSDHDARAEFTEPEILRTNLASVILQMKALRLGDIEDFPFLVPPDPRNVRDGYDTLLEIGALEGGGLRADLTAIGARLARLPVDPRIGRIIIASEAERCVPEALIVASALSVQDPRDRPIDKQAAADEAHATFRHERSDFMTLLNLWREYHKQEDKLSGGGLKKWCREKFISHVRMREWQDVHRQLHELVSDMGVRVERRVAIKDIYDPLHRALLTGFLSSIGRKSTVNPGEYQGARSTTFSIFPGSTLFKSTPKWVVAAEIVRTTRTYARTVASVNPAWIEAAAQHLVKRTYTEPHWDAETAQAMAYETVSLYGLELTTRRRVPYGHVNPDQSRTIFIQHALVNGEYLTPGTFFEHNHTLAKGIKNLESRARSSDLLADNTARFSFYDKRVPGEITSGPEFETWRRRAEARAPDLLHMQKQDLLAPGAVEPTVEQFPDTLEIAGRTLRLTYVHDVGSPDDGVTLTVPESALLAIPASALEERVHWLVPGMLEEKLTALIRALPKHIRTTLVPAPEIARAAAARMAFAGGDLFEMFTDAIRAGGGQYVPVTEWRAASAALPPHLKMLVRVLDDHATADGKPPVVISKSRDLEGLRVEVQKRAADLLSRLPTGPFNRAGVATWVGEFEDLPDTVRVEIVGATFDLTPALVDEGRAGEVSVRLFKDADRAREAHRLGVRKLLALQVSKEASSLIETTPGIERLGLLFAPLAAVSGPMESVKPVGKGGGPVARVTTKDLFADLGALTAALAFDESLGVPPGKAAPRAAELVRSKAAFEAQIDWGWDRLGWAGRQAVAIAEAVLGSYQRITLALADAPRSPAWDNAAIDIRSQLAHLAFARMFAPGGGERGRGAASIPPAQMVHLPRYFAAIERRIEKLRVGITQTASDAALRDAKALQTVWLFWNAYLTRLDQAPREDGTAAGAAARRAVVDAPALAALRWMIEELRVSLFAQELGVRTVEGTGGMTISPPKMEKWWWERVVGREPPKAG